MGAMVTGLMEGMEDIPVDTGVIPGDTEVMPMVKERLNLVTDTEAMATVLMVTLLPHTDTTAGIITARGLLRPSQATDTDLTADTEEATPPTVTDITDRSQVL